MEWRRETGSDGAFPHRSVWDGAPAMSRQASQELSPRRTGVINGGGTTTFHSAAAASHLNNENLNFLFGLGLIAPEITLVLSWGAP